LFLVFGWIIGLAGERIASPSAGRAARIAFGLFVGMHGIGLVTTVALQDPVYPP